MVDSVK